jgi:hypothetical protein
MQVNSAWNVYNYEDGPIMKDCCNYLGNEEPERNRSTNL